MTVTSKPVINIADGSANVGFQAHTVHEVSFYQVAATDPPERKYETGVRCLAGGTPTRARKLFEDALAGGCTTSKVRFHWFLALLSNRSLRDMSPEDTARLRAARRQTVIDDDEWADGLRVIHRLIDAVGSTDPDHGPLFKDLGELPPEQHEKIVRHLDLVLDGELQDHLWRLEVERVKEGRRAGNRERRVWKFFQPTPAGPRARPPTPISTRLADRIRAGAATAVFASATVHLGWLLVERGALGALLAYLVSTAAGYVVAVRGTEWRFRVKRLRIREREHRIVRQRDVSTTDEGFAGQITLQFRQYFGRYVPEGENRDAWLQRTSGIRRHLRDEVVEIYREKEVDAKQVAWLIRHLASDAKQRWQNGLLLAYRFELRTPTTTKLAVVLGLIAMGVFAMWAVVAAVAQAPTAGAATVALLLPSGVLAARGWLTIALERRRHDADRVEYEDRLAARRAAYWRWCAKLADKPDDAEVATWLECDRKLLMDAAMRHYRLKASDVIAHAFLEAPAMSNRKRARVRHGPLRYSRYRILVFLLTRDGVRQASADLDFEKAVFSRHERMNYRFEAVAAVHVTASDDGHPRIFELTLVNGHPINVRVSEEKADGPRPGEDPRILSTVAIEASGLHRALHVLEGVAAEGKEWINRQIALSYAEAATMAGATSNPPGHPAA
ncbi:hypothetical protein [Micromonospora sp. NPDC023956]|uniref:hypothetical protein n=1 Tax=Micromonospora sp. NPDC023956 TaxID=3155722 RepID=UPI0034003FF3